MSKPSKDEVKKALRDEVDPIVVYDVESLIEGVTRQLEAGE